MSLKDKLAYADEEMRKLRHRIAKAEGQIGRLVREKEDLSERYSAEINRLSGIISAVRDALE
jgi:hypothetical protein